MKEIVEDFSKTSQDPFNQNKLEIGIPQASERTEIKNMYEMIKSPEVKSHKSIEVDLPGTIDA